MSRARVLADLLDSTGDVKLDNLDNTPDYTKPSSEPITYISGLQTALDDKVDDAQVLTDVPVSALFSDTVYSKPSAEPISYVTGLQTALDVKVDDAQVLTDVPSGALFTDTTYSVGDGGLTTKDFTTTLKNKLDGVAASANNYSKPSSEPISYVSGLQTALNDKEPADSTILKDADVGTTVLAPDGDGSGLTGIESLPTQTGNVDKILTTDGSSASWVVKPEEVDIGELVLSTQSKDSTKYAVANGSYYSYAVYPEYWEKINSSYTDEEYVTTTGFSSGFEPLISYLELPNNRVLKSYWYLDYNNGNDGYYNFKVELSDDGGATFGSSTNVLSKYSYYQGQYLGGDNLRIVPHYVPDGDFVMLNTGVQSYSSDYGSPYKTGIIKLPSSGTSLNTNQTDKLKKAYTAYVYQHPTSNKLFITVEHAEHGGGQGYYARHVRMYEYDPSTNTMTQHFEVGSGGSSGTYLYGGENRVWYSLSTDKFYVYHRAYGASNYEAIQNYRYGKSGSSYTSQEVSYSDLASMQSAMASDAVELGTWQNPDVDANKYYSYSNNEVHSIESGNYVIRSIDTNAVVNSYSTYGAPSDLSAGKTHTGGMFIIDTHADTNIANISVMLPLATQGANVKFSVPSISFSGTTTYIKTGS